ncbi:MAG: co-chaperone DjlA [Gammaproteobacteria bacterium CG_4_10_14_0_8_um_filter_38_16]|nr:MAG: co-chaperone DjlA [Gammaproteobacteria bacterium CG_4_10_14_0_8_um_filter_38_16]PJA03870.1 MAG: co-chaperone DjlA [Gammaproteobacteria bacterium CG_4_10_14_0_2_um_filter_38_22]PJB10842.1 MAG: co-chaperone DjlA [Gammaproteobacteria bacterium CG_4_9_14_3_um_filter_38_9]
MKFRGKLIGTIFGLMFLGPIGMVFGFIAGHLFDIGYFSAFFQATQGGMHTRAQQIFFNDTFKIMGYIAKSDGHVSEREIQTARMIMTQMGLNALQKEQAIRLFSLGKQPDFNINTTLFELKQVCRLQPALLQLFLDIQLQMASAEGYLSPAKKATLQHIYTQLGIAGFQYNQNQYQQYSYNQQRRATPSDAISLSDAYTILGVSPQSTADEIKRAYRKLMSQNHPDKLIAKGLPPEMIKVATQKTQKIKQAYEQIKKAKGL